MKPINLIPYPIIKAATRGDKYALVEILKTYRQYIRTLSTREFKDDFGNIFYYVDNDIISRLETKLICSIIKDFKILSA